jgi:hypothetical protein
LWVGGLAREFSGRSYWFSTKTSDFTAKSWVHSLASSEGADVFDEFSVGRNGAENGPVRFNGLISLEFLVPSG